MVVYSNMLGPANTLIFGLVYGLVCAIVAGLITGMSRPGTDNASPLSPLSAWRCDRAFGIVTGIGAGLAVWPAGEFRDELIYGPESAYVLLDWMALGLVTGSLVASMYPQAWSSSLAFVQLAASDRTPVRLIRFLEDARSRGVLRTVGPIYQFRHARLQDRLATPQPATEHLPASPAPQHETTQPTPEAPRQSADCSEDPQHLPAGDLTPADNGSPPYSASAATDRAEVSAPGEYGLLEVGHPGGQAVQRQLAELMDDGGDFLRLPGAGLR